MDNANLENCEYLQKLVYHKVNDINIKQWWQQVVEYNICEMLTGYQTYGKR